MKECPTCNRCFADYLNHCGDDGSLLVPSIVGDTVLEGRYELKKRLGQGGMGAVYEARHIFLKTVHAIKIILPEFLGSSDPEFVRRFRQEAMAAANIRHRNVIRVTDYGVRNGIMPFLVMDFIQGKLLQDILAEEKRLSPERSLEIMEPIMAGVGAAHRLGIVHRDLKPLNIMIEDELPLRDAVKVLDFGLAKIKAGELLGSFAAAKSSGVMGSPPYMAPEQWSDEEFDSRTDIYSLGIILYQMLTGNVPFKGTSAPSIMKKHLMDDPPRFVESGVSIPTRVEAVVRHALEKSPANRPQSVDEFISELRAAINEADTTPASLFDTFIPGTVDVRAEHSLNFDDSQTLPRDSGAEQRLQEAEAAARQAAAEEAAARAAEEERRKEEEARQKAAEEERQRAKEEEERRQAEEAARLWAEAEAARKKAEEEEAHRRAEEERLRKEAERKRQAEEEAAARAAEEERLRKEEEEKRRAAARAAELERLRLEEEHRRRLEEEAALKRAEEERKLAEAAERQRKEEEARQKAAEEARRRAEEEERLRLEEEARQRAEAQRRALEEARRLRAEEEARQRAEEEARLRAEEERRAAEEEERQLRAEEARRAEEAAARKRAEEERQRAAEEQARRRKAEEAAARAAEEERLRKEEAARRDEEERRQKEEQRKLAEEAERLRQEEEARRRAEEEAEPQELMKTIEVRRSVEAPAVPAPAHANYETKKSRARVITLAAVAVLLGITGILYLLFSSSGQRVGQGNPGTGSGSLANANTNASSSGQPDIGSSGKQPSKPDLVQIPGGKFLMGRNDVSDPAEFPEAFAQYPAHEVVIEPFLIDRTEVTNAEYADFVREIGYKAPEHWKGDSPPAGNEMLPVVNVSFKDAEAFARWRSMRDGVTYRLPREEEWEFAARGTGNFLYPWGNEWADDRVNLDSDGPRPVGSYPQGASVTGVLDMIGNVWEWTSSKASLYSGNKNLVPVERGRIVVRGGSYLSMDEGAVKKRRGKEFPATWRQWQAKDIKSPTLGFRLVRDLP